MHHARSVALTWLALMAATSASAAVNCPAIERVAALEAKRVVDAPAAQHTNGSDKIQFYTAPHTDCVMPGIFILPGEAVSVNVAYQGFTLVTYINPESQKQTMGWVQSGRLAP